MPTSDSIRKKLLENLDKQTKGGVNTCYPSEVLKNTDAELGFGGKNVDRRVMTAFHAIYRQGLIAFGSDSIPFENAVYLTGRGVQCTERFDRDPSNPNGYMKYLLSLIEIDEIAKAYIEEALRTFNAECHRATAILVGAACEILVLVLRDSIVTNDKQMSSSRQNKLQNAKMFNLYKLIQNWLEEQATALPRELNERYQAYWSPIGQQIRISRNESGHPRRVESASWDSVRASLITFPTFAQLTYDLVGFAEGK